MFRVMTSRCRALACGLIAALVAFVGHSISAQEVVLGPGDVIKLSVFQNPDLTVETRVSEASTINFPLLGVVEVQGLTLSGTEQKIAELLAARSLVRNPQVNGLMLQAVSSQVSVIGAVTRPGRYSLETAGRRLSAVVAMAGGIAEAGGDVLIVTGTRRGQPFRTQVDISQALTAGAAGDDLMLTGGDTVFVPRAPQFYIYGEVRNSGAFRLERNLTVRQAIAIGGGLGERGSERRVSVFRRDGEGRLREYTAGLDDLVAQDDVIQVKGAVL